MKIIRFLYKDDISYGILEGETVREYKSSPFVNSIAAGAEFTSAIIKLQDIRVLAPCQPTKIVCLGLNYRPHAIELQQKLPELPLIFLKPPSAVIGPEDPIVLPPSHKRIDYEGELGVVMGKMARNVIEHEFSHYVLGYTCFNDVTDRIAQKKDGQWTRAKGYDTFAPIGPCIETDISPAGLKIETYVNNVLKQSGNTNDLIFIVPKLVSFISSIMTLFPGDVIATGTPEGIGPLQDGDTVEIRIESIGILRNPVVSSKS